jgi:hypothetical protein
VGQVDHSHSTPADHLSYFEAPDLPAGKIRDYHGICIVTLIRLDNGIKQGVDLLQIAYALSELIGALGILLDEFVYLGLAAVKLRIDKFLQRFFKYIIGILVTWHIHQVFP